MVRANDLRDGDSLVASIGQGLDSAGAVLLVLSKAFLAKNWPVAELRAALNADIERGGGRLHILSATDSAKVAGSYSLLRDVFHTRWTGDSDAYADKVATWFDRPVAQWFVGSHEDAYTGPVWIRVTPTPRAMPADHHASVIWGTNVLELDIPQLDGPISLLHKKQYPGAVPLYVRIKPQARVAIGRGRAPDVDTQVIDAGWDQAKPSGTPSAIS